jgi:hypothetical protein
MRNTSSANRNRDFCSDGRSAAPEVGASSSLTSAGNPPVGSGADLFGRLANRLSVAPGVAEHSGHGFVPTSVSFRGRPQPGHATVAIGASRYFAAF